MAARKLLAASSNPSDYIVVGGNQDNNTPETHSIATTNEDAPNEDNPKVTHGSIPSTKDIYGQKADAKGKYNWVKEYPKDVPGPSEDAETAKYAIIVRNIMSSDSMKTLEAHSIIVQSPWLRKALGDYILKDYPGITCELSRLEFEAPFQPFVHRWTDLLEFRKRDDVDEITAAHVEVLHDFLQREIGELIKAHGEYVQAGAVTYDHLWMIFQPGDVVIQETEGGQAYELGQTQYVEIKSGPSAGHYLQLTCDCVSWSGTAFGRGTEKILLEKYLGTRKIETLGAFPLKFHENREELKEMLIKRGEKFEALAGYQYKAYSGMAITWNRQGCEQPIHVSGRVVIDTDAFNRFSGMRARPVAPFKIGDISKLGHQTVPKEGSKRIKLTPDYQMLCTPRLRGYSIKLKKWLDFFVDNVSEIQWNDHAFENLVLDEQQKDLILSFTESQVANNAGFDDVIQGKGKGIVILLSGSPGIGKTLTAEAVAECMRVPLHTITSGELGSEAYTLESQLSSALGIVSQWNAILLLDEADVFLEARSAHDLKRNQIVSIFLRTLEYYEGILFMTTNRVNNIDEAFQSRIHVSLEYPGLNDTSRRKIWTNIANSRQHSFTERDFDELATIDLNGRQIKNVLKTAHLLASRRRQLLDRKVVDVVLAIEKRRPGVGKNLTSGSD